MLHHCFNVVTGPEGRGEAVLVRALEPLEGLDLMRERRGREEARELCSGPARLVQAMGIGPEHDGVSLEGGALRLVPSPRSRRATIEVGPRVGITRDAEHPYRFWLRGCRWRSR